MDTTLNYLNKKYVFKNSVWYDADTYLQPPAHIAAKLNTLIRGQHTETDQTLMNAETCIRDARQARMGHDLARAQRLFKRALELKPGDIAIITALASLYREQSQPHQALLVTEDYKNYPSIDLLSTRAAAHCDMKNFADAKRTITLAINLGRSDSALFVVRRILSAHPEWTSEFKDLGSLANNELE